MKEIEIIISTIIMSCSLFAVGDILLDKSEKVNFKNFSITIGISLIIILVNLVSASILDNILKIIIIFISYIGYYKLVFGESLIKSILASFIMYLIFFITESLVVFIVYIIFFFLQNNNAAELKNSVIINLIICLIGILITLKFKKQLSSIIDKINSDKRTIFIIALAVLLALAILFNKTPVNELELNINFIITICLMILLCIVGFILIKQKYDVDKMADEYKKLADYSQVTEGVLEEYRLNLHESRNQLIIIKNMVSTSTKKELEEYIDNLIQTTEVNKYRWVNELKYIPIPELKGFINFKLMEMSNKKIDIEINVERKLKKSKMKTLKIKDKGDLYSIIGVFLDNAREASLESKEKRVAVEMYEIDNDLHVIIANTYKGKIDINKINEYGYSSKGKNRGTGLHLVNKIVEENIMFDRTTSKIDEYFVQELIVHLKNIK